MYIVKNYKTKKAIREDIASGIEVRIFQPNAMRESAEMSPTYTGRAFLEGPHFPAPHSWYAEATVENGKVIKIK